MLFFLPCNPISMMRKGLLRSGSPARTRATQTVRGKMSEKISRTIRGRAKEGAGQAFIVGRSTNGQIFSKAYGSHGNVTIMDKAAFRRASSRADRVLAENAAKRK